MLQRFCNMSLALLPVLLIQLGGMGGGVGNESLRKGRTNCHPGPHLPISTGKQCLSPAIISVCHILCFGDLGGGGGGGGIFNIVA